MSSPWLKYAVLAGGFVLAICIIRWFGFTTSVQLGSGISLVAVAAYFVHGALRGRSFISLMGSSFILSALPLGMLAWMNGQQLAVWAEMMCCLWILGFILTAYAAARKRSRQVADS